MYKCLYIILKNTLKKNQRERNVHLHIVLYASNGKWK